MKTGFYQKYQFYKRVIRQKKHWIKTKRKKQLIFLN